MAPKSNLGIEQGFEVVKTSVLTVSVPGAKVTTSGKAHAKPEMITIPRAFRQKSRDKNANIFVCEDHMASRPETVKARVRTVLHAHCKNAVPALTLSAEEMIKAKAVPIALAPAWEWTSSEALVPEVSNVGAVLLRDV